MAFADTGTPNATSTSGSRRGGQTASSYCNKYKGNAKTACESGFSLGSSECARYDKYKSQCQAGASAAANNTGSAGSSSGGGGSGGGSGGGGSGSGSGSSGSTTDDGPSGDGSGAESSPPPGPETINCDTEVNCEDPAASGSCDNEGCDLIGKYVNPAITALSAMVGIAAVASLIYAGIQYSTSSGDPQKVAEAKDRITKTLMAFVMYLFFFAFLQFLIPGGIIR